MASGLWAVRAPDWPTLCRTGAKSMAARPKAAPDDNDATHIIPTTSKLGQMVRLLLRTRGATLDNLEKATGWQRHSIRGAISGSLRGKYGLKVEVTNEQSRGRVYRIRKTAKQGGAR